MILAGGAMGQLEIGSDALALLQGVVEAVQDAWTGLREGLPLVGGPLETLQPLLMSLIPAAPHEQPATAIQPAASESIPALDELERAAPRPASHAALAQQNSRLILGKTNVRVPVEKLDSLLAQSGEMLLAERRLVGSIAEVQQIREQVRAWRREWTGLDRAVLRQLATAVEDCSERDSHGGAQTVVRRPVVRVTEQLQERERRITQLERDLDRIARSLTRDGQQIRRAWEGLNEDVHRVRMLPFSEACRGFDRLVRDMAHSLGKQIDLVIEGGQTQLDSAILDRLRGPLVHLLQNAADHGIEPAQERIAAGKPALGKLKVSAVVQGGQVEVTIADDGRGLNLEALAERLRRHGRPAPEDERELIHTIFQPGVSTSAGVSDLSGRGVGLDVVKSEVEQMHGAVDVSFMTGKGTQFRLRLPLTLTTLRVLLVTAGGETFAFASSAVERLLLVSNDDVRQIAGRSMLAAPGRPPLPLVRLSDVLGSPNPGRIAPGAKTPVVLLHQGLDRAALAVESFVAEQDVVVKSLGSRLIRLRHLAGASVLPSGRIALLLNTAELIEGVLHPSGVIGETFSTPAAQAPVAVKRLLVAEDSFTTRTLLKHRLEAAGYHVTAARHGAEAWALLQEEGADLLLSDVDMPELDGFRLTQKVRRSPQFRYLPIVLMTSRATAADRAAGAEAGANAYLVKSAFDQRALLETIAQLI
jgi:two-component system chemotaxis sensor kinase CheA